MTNDHRGYGLADDYVNTFKALGIKVLIGCDLNNDYQGDWVGLVDTGGYLNHYGFIVTGYGSCSGCDELQGAETILERIEVIREILSRTSWFDSLDAAKAHIADQGAREQDWYPHEENWPKFVAAVANADEYMNELNLTEENA